MKKSLAYFIIVGIIIALLIALLVFVGVKAIPWAMAESVTDLAPVSIVYDFGGGTGSYTLANGQTYTAASIGWRPFTSHVGTVNGRYFLQSMAATSIDIEVASGSYDNVPLTITPPAGYIFAGWTVSLYSGSSFIPWYTSYSANGTIPDGSSPSTIVGDFRPIVYPQGNATTFTAVYQPQKPIEVRGSIGFYFGTQQPWRVYSVDTNDAIGLRQENATVFYYDSPSEGIPAAIPITIFENNPYWDFSQYQAYTTFILYTLNDGTYTSAATLPAPAANATVWRIPTGLPDTPLYGRVNRQISNYMQFYNALENQLEWTPDTAYNSGYDVGFDSGYNNGYNQAQYTFYNSGYNAGYADGVSVGFEQVTPVDTTKSLLNSVGDVLSIKVIAGVVSIGDLLLIVVALAIITFLLKIRG